MPPLIVWALGAVGAAVLVNQIAKQVRRVNAALRGHGSPPAADGVELESIPRLVRDPATGVYRPK
jgi:hypothetical protein